MTSMADQLQPFHKDEDKASEFRSVLLSQTMEHLLGEPKNSTIEWMRLHAYFHYGADAQLNNLRSSSLLLSKPDSAPCRYFTMPGGCVRGEKCLFSHPNAEIMSVEMGQSFMPKQNGSTKRITAEDLRKKIFVGGLSPSVESGDLRDFFEENYGPVLDAVVIGSQAGDQMQSRGFGFVTFKHAESVSAAVEAHYINIYGKQVEIKGAVPRSELSALEISRADSDTLSHSPIAMSANNVLELDDADVLEVATRGSLSLSKNELLQCNQTLSAIAEPQQDCPSENVPSSLSRLPSSSASTVSSDAISRAVIREASSESASPTSHGLSPANVSNVSRDTYSHSVIRGGSSRVVQEREPAWLNTFKEWLPEFLARVSMRLKDGEWYPLSSLKGDYRAICGLELDHVSLGFEKLSDFVRSFPDLCRMKIVPVGRGPATHMVLLPPHMRSNPLVASRRNLPNITSRSLVDGTRSYAEVACHGAAARLRRTDIITSSNPTFCTGGTNIVRQGMLTGVPSSSGSLISSAERRPSISEGALRRWVSPVTENCPRASYTAAAGYNAGLISTSNGSIRTLNRAEGHSQSDLSNGSTATSNSSSSSSSRPGSHVASVHTDDTETLSSGEMSSPDVNSGLSKEDFELLQELISRLKETGMDYMPGARNHAATGYQPALMTIHDTRSPPKSRAHPEYQAPQKRLTKNVDNDKEKSLHFPVFDQEPNSPTCENNPPNTPFNHPFPGFLPENFPSNSSMWGQDANSNRIKEGGHAYGYQGRAIESFSPSCQIYEDSPHSNDSIYGTPRGYLSASSSPGQGYPKMAGLCEMCFERQALWVAVPCGHKNLCSNCKGSLGQGNQDTAQCFVCNVYVERWIALH